MAEVVNKILESMVPELEELQRVGLFSEEEVRCIIKRRREMEYRMFRRPAVKEDYLRAIQYELNLDKLKKQRKEMRGVVSVSKEGAFGVTNRIHALFKRSLKRFKGDTKLWLQYIAFCRQLDQVESLSRVFGKALAIHPSHTGLWIMAAKFEFEDLKDTAAARTLLQQGLRANPSSHRLWHEYFRMELLHTEKLLKRRSLLGLDMNDEEANASDAVLSYKVAGVVYRQAVLAIPDDVRFRLQFLPIVQLFDGTDEIEEEIFTNIKHDFEQHPLYWDALARRGWARCDSEKLTEKEIAKLESTTEQIYHKGIKSVGQEWVGLMWEKLLVWCVERVQAATSAGDRSASRQATAIERLITQSRHAAEAQTLTESVSLTMVDTLLGYGLVNEAQRVAQQAAICYPSSPTVWMSLLQCESAVIEGKEEVKEERMNRLCSEAIEKVPSKVSLPLWKHWVTHLISIGAAKDSISKVFEESTAVGVAPIVREEMSRLYLDWCVMTGGIKPARRVYKRLLASKPVMCSVYLKCIQLENAQEEPCIHRLRKLFEAGIEEYGTTNPEMWLEYIKAEMSVDGGMMDKIGELHWRATNTLDGSCTADFISSYSLMTSKV